MASNIKVDIVKPTATNGSLSLKGDSGGSATANGITVDSSGNTTITGNFTSKGIDDNASSGPALTIDASGNVGIGTSSPDYPLHVSGTLGYPVLIQRTNANDAGIRFQDNSTTDADSIRIGAEADNFKIITGGTERMRIDSSGHVRANTFKNLAGTGAPDFPNGLTLASNTTGGNITGVTLDDYEEGTWALTNGNFGTFTSVTATAKYIKIGNLVFVYFLQTGGTIDPTAATKYLQGLPFAPDPSGGSGSWSDGSVTFNVTALISVSAGVGRIWTPVDFGSTINLCFSGTYYTS